MAALESLAAGVPVIASAVGGLPSVVKDGKTGWLFPSGDLDTAQECIETWRHLPVADQARMRRTCWELVRDNFSEARQLPKILAVYSRAV